ncbi:PREDICTED: histone H2A deubiquitinase MYSM1 [Nanorana parkeri]|uniref:histone H2A deubiquitinase MYSM1 n=1 Tax=Nanorana parkeri TaxID=125878 RepID=UPI000854E02A|nr:PREDICTED: histone H2A deubiquitinase MYSM1 [Nanorana parkeri]
MAEEADVDIEGDVADCSKGTYEEPNSGFVPDHYLDSMWKGDDVLTPWTLDSSISDENRVAIERMLLEEEYYLSNKPLQAKFWSDSNNAEKAAIKRSPQKKTARAPIRSPSKPSSGAVKWTAEEKDLFEQGLATFGRRWTNIARLIGSRTVLQVKSYARQYFKNKCKENGEKDGNTATDEFPVFHAENSEEEAKLSAFRGRADPNLNAVKIETLSDDEEVDITDEVDEAFVSSGDLPDSAINPADKICQVKEEAIHPATEQSHLTPEQPHTYVAETEALCHKEPDDEDAFYCFTCVPHSDTLTPAQDEGASQDSTSASTQDKDDDVLTVQSYEHDDSQDGAEDLKVPDQEVLLDPDFIQEEEKQAIPEFFEGRPAKTPERYLRIRNYILGQWKNCKPNYLNKTSVRPGLKNCGDVNCIGRIHTYLELIGAINFGCEQAVYNRPRPLDKTKTKLVKDALEVYELAHRLQTMRTRRRRVRGPWGNWCDAKDLEGQTFEHLSAEEVAQRRERMRSLKCSRGPRPPKSTFDPFQLIPCLDFTEEKQAPFRVKISAEAMLILDLHAHISLAEVIGLLGGRYSEEERIVEIWAAEPCNSLSTGLQCEMDPVSQTQASEALSLSGYNVIGWYHSHPAFDPNPSIRDIDTQAKYQSYFSRGGAKFLGMIISPYNRSNPLPQSQLTCLVISDDVSEDGSYRMPYRFDVELMSGQPSWEVIFEKTRWIIEKYRLSHSSVPMNKRFRQDSDLTCLEKLLTCLRRTLVNAACSAFADEFLSRIEDYFLSSYTSNKDVEDVGGALAVAAEIETEASTSDPPTDG